MCVILDINKWGDFFKRVEDMKPVIKWLDKTGKLVYSNHEKFQKELPKKARKTLEQYLRSGKAKFISDQDVKEQIKNIQQEYKIKSNDMHILGLAKASDTKVICTEDKDLHADFKKVVKCGKIYQKDSHKLLLKPNTCQ